MVAASYWWLATGRPAYKKTGAILIIKGIGSNS